MTDSTTSKNNASEVATKTCLKCGKTKPTTEFYASSSATDGLQTYCKDCKKEMNRMRSALNRRRKEVKGLNPLLADFQPRELIAELRARGYYGELKFINVIKV